MMLKKAVESRNTNNLGKNESYKNMNVSNSQSALNKLPSQKQQLQSPYNSKSINNKFYPQKVSSKSRHATKPSNAAPPITSISSLLSSKNNNSSTGMINTSSQESTDNCNRCHELLNILKNTRFMAR